MQTLDGIVARWEPRAQPRAGIFAGMSEIETADALELPPRSCQRLWADARARLETMLAS